MKEKLEDAIKHTEDALAVALKQYADALREGKCYPLELYTHRQTCDKLTEELEFYQEVIQAYN